MPRAVFKSTILHCAPSFAHTKAEHAGYYRCLLGMNERAEECKSRALECERAAQKLFATDSVLSDLFLDLAHRWREMAKEGQHQ